MLFIKNFIIIYVHNLLFIEFIPNILVNTINKNMDAIIYLLKFMNYLLIYTYEYISLWGIYKVVAIFLYN